MLSKTLCLTFYIPLLVLAYTPSTRFTALPKGPTPQSANARHSILPAKQDTLNRTACFCASSHWAMDQTYGSYYRISYYNADLNRTFILEPACQSRISINEQENYDPDNKPVLQNECLRSHADDPMRYCTGKDTDKDAFCYTLAGWPDHDSWSLNGQHRTMQLLASDFKYPPNVVEQVCEESCKEKVGGLEMLKGDALEVL